MLSGFDHTENETGSMKVWQTKSTNLKGIDKNTYQKAFGMNMLTKQHVLYTKIVPELTICKLHWKFPIFLSKTVKSYLDISSYTTEFNLEFPEKFCHFIGIQLFKTKLNLAIKNVKTWFSYFRGN